MSEKEVLISSQNGVGHMVLNRPKALNALSHQMVLDMLEAMKVWQGDPDIHAVLIEGAGDRAFCAGGDIQAVYENGRTDHDAVMQFWRDEYELNALIKNFPKPYVAMMHGFIMGGGVGVSAHGSHRIVTDNSIISMPETGIGFLPDVGGTYLLSRAPGGLGYFYGLTGGRMTADDAIYCGFADYYVPEDKFNALKEAILAGGDVDELIKAQAATPPEGDARWHDTQIADWFADRSFDDAMAAIEADESEFAQKALKVLKRQCPLSVKSTFRAIYAAKELDSIEPCLGQEFRFADASLYDVNFYEGIRAAIIEKGRNPQWVPATLDQVSEQMVEAMFKPLGEKELKLK